MQKQVGAKSTTVNRLGSGYTFTGLFQLFLVCAFPIHAWAILMAFRDFSWVSERTRIWDGIGLLAYALTYSLMETIGIFLLLLLLSLFMPKRWDANRRVAFLGCLFLVAAVWGILGQLYSYFGEPVPQPVVDFLVRSGHPIRIIWGVLLPLIALSAGLPAIAIAGRDKAMDGVMGFFERISLLSLFYIILDVAGIIIILIRSVTV